MSNRRLLNNRMSSDDESIFETEYLTSILKVVNGYCKINLEVPQIRSFHSSNSLLPINAKVNSTMFNKGHSNNTPDGIADMFKNVMDLKTNENMNKLDENQLHSLNTTSVNENKIYSKPSYSENSDYIDKKEYTDRSVSPKTRRKKKYIRSSNIDIIPSTQMHTDRNISLDYPNQCKDERLEDGTQSKQEQEVQRKHIKNMRINLVSRSRTSISRHSNSENRISEGKLPCPLCFDTFTPEEIEEKTHVQRKHIKNMRINLVSMPGTSILCPSNSENRISEGKLRCPICLHMVTPEEIKEHTSGCYI